MKNYTYLFLIIAVVYFFASSSNADTRWRDEKTGTHFLLIKEKMSHANAYKACSSRGWDILNYEYLSAEEKERFKDSDTLKGLKFTPRFVGEPGEHSEVTLWGTSRWGAIPTHGGADQAVSVLSLVEFPTHSSRRSSVAWTHTQALHDVVCMYQSHTWVGCAHEYQCTYEEPGGGTTKMRYSMYEYGSHTAQALQRIRERAKNFPIGVGARCEIAAKDPVCTHFR